MELGSLIGFVAGTIFMVVTLLLSAGGNVGDLVGFIDYPSLLCVFGGSITSMLVAYPLPVVLNGLKSMGLIFKPLNNDPSEAIKKIIDLANLARREGLLALEEAVSDVEDLFLKKGVMLVVDGTDPELVRNILETELAYQDGRHKETAGVWEFWGELGPAYGMIGTLIGLVMLLANLDDPSQIGPKMSVAILTTMYGSLLANFLCIPVAKKMNFFNADEMLMKEVLIEGMLSIQAGENPRIIEEKLKSFLSPTQRANIGEEGGE